MRLLRYSTAPRSWEHDRLTQNRASHSPPTLCNSQTVDVPIGQQFAVRHRFAVRRRELYKHKVYQSAVTMNQLLALGIHLGSLGIVVLRSGLSKKTVKSRVLPRGLIPF